ncbi:MAG: hypothetical protein WBC73_07670 [Phormidesmis sp.]
MKTAYRLSGRLSDQLLRGQLLTDRTHLSSRLTPDSLPPAPLPQLTPAGTAPGESVRHILLGSPDAVRQTIHLLHTLHYSEPILWSPVLAIAEAMVITPAQGEAISLLRKPL